jgi:hypothetical protein
MPMRRLCVILLAAGCLAPVALAAPRAAGDGTLAGAKINGTVTVIGHGAIWGQLSGDGTAAGQATLVILDKDPDVGPAPKVSGYDSVQIGTAAGSLVYTAKGSMRFQLGGPGRYRIDLAGKSIDFSAVGSGRARVVASTAAAAPGKYAVDDDAWQVAPYQGTTEAGTWISFPDDATSSP